MQETLRSRICNKPAMPRMPFNNTLSPRISVVVCTHNRASLLQQAIASLLQQSLPAVETEVVIVNNASSDGTARVLAELPTGIPGRTSLRILDEPTIGLSYARNTGVSACRGPYVAFLDDDAVANPDWLQGLLDVFARAPRAAIVGGPVEPLCTHSPPTWLVDEQLWNYCSIVNLGKTARAIDTRTEWLAGTNIAFQRSALESIGGFSLALGRTGSNLLSNEETDAVARLASNGFEAWYAPNAGVKHRVHSSRMTRRWLLHRAFWQGMSDVAVAAPSLTQSVGHLSRGRIDLLLLRSLGKSWAKECLLHDLIRRPTRMVGLTNQARRLGKDYALDRV